MTIKMFIISVALCLIILTTLSIQDIQQNNVKPRIIDGTSADIKDFPYQVALQIWNGYAFIPYCGGSVLNTSFIITAAHCFYLPTENNDTTLVSSNLLRISAGSNDSYGYNIKGQRILVKRLIIHRKYKYPKFNHDIALLELNDTLNISDYVRPIRLRTNNSIEGEICTVSGWGATKSKGDFSRELLKTDVPIVSHDTCAEKYRRRITNNMICAGYVVGHKDACQGDSGGPLVCNKELTGIVSFGRGCGIADVPGVYTQVSEYINWIQETASGYKHKASIKIILLFNIFSIINININTWI